MYLRKLSMPKLENDVVDKKSIEKKLMHLPEYKIAVITAPAGYGKTTVVSNYLMNQPVRFSWFSLDASDKDPVKFWRNLTTSVALSTKKYELADISINEELLMSNITINIFIEMLKEISDEFILVLDNCHFMNSELVLESMSFFIRHLPQNISVICMGRREPNELFTYDYKKAIIRIGIKELAFDLKEIKELLIKKDIFVNECDMRSLEQSTDGWPLGLVISSFQYNHNYSNISNNHFDKYFQSEVLAALPEDIRDFMIHTSFLDMLTGPLCCRVTGIENSEEIIKKLLRNNSFIIDQENNTYRFHVMFKEYLTSILKKENPELQRSFYCNAGEWFLENNLFLEAISCYVKADDYEKALKLICEKRDKFELSDYSVYQKLIESLPRELWENNILICADYSWILSMENNLEAAEYWADKAQACFDQCCEGMDKTESEYLEEKVAMSCMNLAIMKMDVDMAEQYYMKIAELNRCAAGIAAELNTVEISLLKTDYGFKGNLDKIDETYSRYIESMPELLGDISCYFAVILAECQYERNDLQAVYTTLSKFMGRITRLKYPGVIVPCIILLAKEKLAKGRIDEAFDLIESGKKMLPAKNNTLWMRYFDLFTASLYIHTGDAAKVLKYLEIDGKSVFDQLSGSCEFEYIVFARYLILINNLDESLLLLSRLEEFARTENRRMSLVEILCLKAINHYYRGEPSEAMSDLDAALKLGMADRYVRTFINEGQPMADLLAKYRTWERFKGEQKHSKYVRMLTDHMNSYMRAAGSADSTDTSLSEQISLPSLMSARELEVLQLLMAEYSNAEIADELFITERTVKHHNARIYEKLGVNNRLEAIMKAKEIRLIG
jgi:LuxR family maltose regulon positive regulatory protein